MIRASGADDVAGPGPEFRKLRFLMIANTQGGETIRRVPIAKGDVILGDRAYSNPAGEIGRAHV